MPAKGSPPHDFVLQVRSALVHLYDYAYLQKHPLADRLDAEVRLDQVTRAQRVRRALLDCVEALRPQGQGDLPLKAARAYAILICHYVDGLAMEEIARKLALSRRQAYREHEKGIEAVASVLWQMLGAEDESHGPEQPPHEEPAQDRLAVAHAEVQRLRQSVRTEALDLAEILHKALELLTPRLRQAGLDLEVASSSPWPAVAADRVMLRQALLNLLSHAIDAAPRRRLVITATAAQDLLTLRIEAAGEARPVEIPHEPTVGLAVAQALIEAEGGCLEVLAAADQWRACISLPRAGRTVILAIDDNADIVSLLRRYLAGHDVSVVGASDGEQALRLAAELRPYLITLDVMMPSQDGWETLQKLKDSPTTKDIPVIVCSVLNEPQLALSMGARAYLTKPISQVGLLEVLQQWLGRLRPVA